MKYNELFEKLENLRGIRPSQQQIADILGVRQSVIGNRAVRNSKFSEEELKHIEDFYGIDLMGDNDCIPVTYRPDVYLSAGYGVEVLDENKEIMMVDSRLLMSERGNKINPDDCEIVRVSGNSMSPEYRHGDRVIIDKGDRELLDGHIFAFRYKGCCYVKELNLLGDKIKCISLNKEYDPFYIKKGEPFAVLGRIIPRVRL